MARKIQALHAVARSYPTGNPTKERVNALRSLFLLLLLTCLLCLSLAAASGEEFGEKLIRDSDAIFVGDLVHSESFRSSRNGMIMTRHVFRVKESLKGDSGDYVEILEYGGTVGEVTLEVSHSVHYSPGAEYLIFSARDNLQQTRTMGGALGAIPVLETANAAPQLRMLPDHPLLSVLGARQRSMFLGLPEMVTAISSMIEVQK